MSKNNNVMGRFHACIAFCLAATMINTAQSSEIPELPLVLEEQGALRVGVRCDYPPDGYYDSNGRPTGVEVEFAKRLAEIAFDDSSYIELHCVTSANRIPTLVGNRVDLLIATLGISEERMQVIDFSVPYAWSASSILVPETSDIQSMEDLRGQTVILLKGAWQIPWFEKNMPDVELVRLDSVSDAMQALLQNRGAAFAHDFASQVQIADRNENIRMLDDRYQIGYRGIGLRKGDDELREYLNAAIEKVQREGYAITWVEAHNDEDLAAIRAELWDLSKVPQEED